MPKRTQPHISTQFKRITRSQSYTLEFETKVTGFITTLYNKIKLKENVKDLDLHQRYVYDTVQTICNKLGELFPVFKIEDCGILPNGSYYHRTKILEADEFDYLIPLALALNKDVKIEHVSITRLQVSIVSEELTDSINETCSEFKSTKRNVVRDGKIKVGITKYIRRAIDKCLTLLNQEGRLQYKGEKDMRMESSDNHELFLNQQIELDTGLHGPCVRLRVGGPLCVADVDLGFCMIIPKSYSDGGCYVALPIQPDWVESFYEYPDKCRIDKHHALIVMTLKYMIHICIKDLPTSYSSFAITTIVHYHQRKCKMEDISDNERTLGRCFNDVANFMFSMINLKEDGNSVTIGRKWEHDLWNIDINRVNLFESFWPMDQLFSLFLYAWLKTVKSTKKEGYSCEWYCQQLRIVCQGVTSKFVEKNKIQYQNKSTCCNKTARENSYEYLNHLSSWLSSLIRKDITINISEYIK